MKAFKLSKEEIKVIAPGHGYCFATDKITVDGEKVRYMDREQPDRSDDSGWRFYSGTESQEYANDPNNTMIYDVNTIANYDKTIVDFLNMPFGTTLKWDDEGNTFKVSDE